MKAKISTLLILLITLHGYSQNLQKFSCQQAITIQAASNSLEGVLDRIRISGNSDIDANERLAKIPPFIENNIAAKDKSSNIVHDDIDGNNNTFISMEAYLRKIVAFNIGTDYTEKPDWRFEVGKINDINYVFIYSQKTIKLKSGEKTALLKSRWNVNDPSNPTLLKLETVADFPTESKTLTEPESNEIIINCDASNVFDGIKLEVMTNKGRENVQYKDQEEMSMSFRLVSSDSTKTIPETFYVRVVYFVPKLNCFSLLVDNFPVNNAKLNQEIKIKDTFTCSAPFGNEYLVAAASNLYFQKLTVKSIEGIPCIQDNAYTIITKPRAMVKKGFLEDKVLITTSN